MARVELYDTTLRDGAQTEGISFSVEDKVRITGQLDALGVPYVEGGWPGSNPKDVEFFKRMAKRRLSHATLTAFGSTRRADRSAAKDPNLQALVAAQTRVVTIFGKSWDLHVREVFRIPLAQNLSMIHESVAFLKKRGVRVFYDAEHFFDGYKDNPAYAMQTVKAAQEAGAEVIILCDTNGGSLPSEIGRITAAAKLDLGVPLGIHTHNDCGLGVANALAAVEAGAVQVQGTINGYGERCGNADLVCLLPVLQLKMGIECLPAERIKALTETARFVAEVSNMGLRSTHPFVGPSAFAHKGGVHVNAVMKNPRTYEHLDPRLVGNERRILVSELSGKSSLVLRAKGLALNLHKETPEAKKLLGLLQQLEHEGYHFEAAEGSFELLLRRAVQRYQRFFELEGFRVVIEKRGEGALTSEAIVKVRVDGQLEHTAAHGDGPVNALDNAVRKALQSFYPTLAQMHLADFKVRVLDGTAGTAAKVRVLIQSQDAQSSWGTVGVSTNIIEASWQALADSIEYKLLKDQGTTRRSRRKAQGSRAVRA